MGVVVVFHLGLFGVVIWSLVLVPALILLLDPVLSYQKVLVVLLYYRQWNSR